MPPLSRWNVTRKEPMATANPPLRCFRLSGARSSVRVRIRFRMPAPVPGSRPFPAAATRISGSARCGNLSDALHSCLRAPGCQSVAAFTALLAASGWGQGRAGGDSRTCWGLSGSGWVQARGLSGRSGAGSAGGPARACIGWVGAALGAAVCRTFGLRFVSAAVPVTAAATSVSICCGRSNALRSLSSCPTPRRGRRMRREAPAPAARHPAGGGGRPEAGGSMHPATTLATGRRGASVAGSRPRKAAYGPVLGGLAPAAASPPPPPLERTNSVGMELG